MKKRILLSWCVVFAGASIIRSGDGAGADKYGNTHAGSISARSDGAGGGGGADADVTTTSRAAGASDRSGRFDQNRFSYGNNVFGNRDLAENIAQFIPGREAVQGLGYVNKASYTAAEHSSRFAHAAAVAQPVLLVGHFSTVTSVAAMPNGRIVSGSRDATVRVWNLTIREGQPGHMVVLRGHEEGVMSSGNAGWSNCFRIR